MLLGGGEVPVPWTGARTLLNDSRVQQSHFSRLPICIVCGLLTGSPANPQKLWVLLEWQEEITDLEME